MSLYKKNRLFSFSIIISIMIFTIVTSILSGCTAATEHETDTKQTISDTQTSSTVSSTGTTATKIDSYQQNNNTPNTDETTTTAIIFNSNEPENSGNINDIETQRHYFILGVEAFEAKEYVKAQYYLDKIKSKYIVLEDHIRYYLAKSTLLQEKYDLSSINYQFIIDNFQDSIFREKSFLELADSYYLNEDYSTAEKKYDDYIKEYPDSALT